MPIQMYSNPVLLNKINIYIYVICIYYNECSETTSVYLDLRRLAGDIGPQLLGTSFKQCM